MSENAESFLSHFDSLPAGAQHEVAVEILRRSATQEASPLTDDELGSTAEALFLDYDERESAHGG